MDLNFFLLKLCHWLHILKSVWNAKGISHKLSVLVKGPGWQPGKSRLGDIKDIPDVSKTDDCIITMVLPAICRYYEIVVVILEIAVNTN
jgi:hypothetical protein